MEARLFKSKFNVTLKINSWKERWEKKQKNTIQITLQAREICMKMPDFQKRSTCRIPHLVCNTKQWIILALEHFWQSVSFGQVFPLVYSDYVRVTRAGNPSACDLCHHFWQSNGDNSMISIYSLKKLHGELNNYKARR